MYIWSYENCVLIVSWFFDIQFGKIVLINVNLVNVFSGSHYANVKCFTSDTRYQKDVHGNLYCWDYKFICIYARVCQSFEICELANECSVTR